MRLHPWFLSPAALLLLAAPAEAQRTDLDGRVGRLESEMHAVQRKVFPGGAGASLQPEVEAAPVTGPVAGAPSGSAVADLTARVAALEGQLASLTGQVEQADFRSRQASSALDAYRRTTDARLKALEGAGAGAGSAGPGALAGGETGVDTTVDGAVEPALAQPAPRPTPRPARPTPRPTAAAVPADDEPSPAPHAAAIAKPSTGDPAEDAYVYGYRLWQAKRYGDAQAALKKAVADYPKSKRFSYSQNLLGRAYLDDGKPSLASMAFYDNYKKMPDGERAPESLYYLAQALVKLNKPADACKVYAELTDVYAGKIGTRMKADVAAGRATAKCK